MNHSSNAMAFLPGWGFNASVFQTVANRYTAASIQLIDWPAPCDFDLTLEHIAKQLVDGTTLVAWSLGGLYAIELANRYPDKIAHCALICTTPKFVTDDDWLGIDYPLVDQFKQSAAHDLQRLCDRFLKITLYPNREKELYLKLKPHQITDSAVLLHYLDQLFSRDVRSSFKKLGKKVSLILSECDAIIPVGVDEYLRRLNPCAAITILKNAGHAPFLSQTDAFMEWLYASF